MMRTWLLSLTAAAALAAAPLAAQDRAQTLADIRQELTVLYIEIQNLKRELSTTGSPTAMQLQGTSALDRINAMESELQRLTAATEELTNRVDRVVTDGTNRIGDLEFRLVELEGGDISQLGETTTLGGDMPGQAGIIAPPPQTGAEMAVGEQADFDRAMEAFNSGAYETAVTQFATFTETYTGGPLTAQAHFWRGKALAALGNTHGAAKAYLASYSGDPQNQIAPTALLELGLSLDALGQLDEACIMLGEVTSRYPNTPDSMDAQAARANMGCG